MMRRLMYTGSATCRWDRLSGFPVVKLSPSPFLVRETRIIGQL